MGRCSRLGDRARLQAQACRLPHDRRGAEPSPRRSDDVRRAQRRSAFGGVEWFAHCAHRKTGREWTWHRRIRSAGARRFRRQEYGRFGHPVGGVNRSARYSLLSKRARRRILDSANERVLSAPHINLVRLTAVAGGPRLGSNNFREMSMKNIRKMTRRDAINYSCMTVAGLSLVGLKPKKLAAQGQPQAQEPWPDTL